MAIESAPKDPNTGHWIFTKTIKTRTGKVLVAANYGLVAFHIFVKGSESKN